MFIKKCLIISCLLSFLTACDNNKKKNESLKEEKEQIKQQIEIVNQPIIDIDKPIIEDNTEIIKDEQIKQLNNDYQLFIDEFNAINQQKKYQIKLDHCQTLINKLQPYLINLKNNKLIKKKLKL